MFGMKVFIADGWNTCMLHSIMCYNSSSQRVSAINAVVVLWHLCRKCDNFGWQEPKWQVLQKLWQNFHWALGGLVSTDSLGWIVLSGSVPQGVLRIKGGDVGHQVKTKKTQVCHWLNELLNKPSCFALAHLIVFPALRKDSWHSTGGSFAEGFFKTHRNYKVDDDNLHIYCCFLGCVESPRWNPVCMLSLQDKCQKNKLWEWV